MSVPLDRLYNHLSGLCNHDVLIYRFLPHGSKNLKDLKPLYSAPWFRRMTSPVMICHDQEPLSFDAYTPDQIVDSASWVEPESFRHNLAQYHIRTATCSVLNAFDSMLLCHSEQNSAELAKFESTGLIGVYWWSHAAIAQDWFRHARIDPDISYRPNLLSKDFLIYNRAWSGTREYRLKFAESLANNGLVDQCRTKFSAYDNGQHYQNHQYHNPVFELKRFDLEQCFEPNNADSHASADYDRQDYRDCAMEVVLETLYDDTRHHLTEKVLRPIACRKPFLLMSTPKSLQYLRRYGIKTFHELIDESYDNILDPADRMQAVVREMRRIADLPAKEKAQLWDELDHICDYNQRLFFSDQWLDTVLREFADNFNTGIERLVDTRSGQIYQQYCRAQSIDMLFDPEKQKYLEWLAKPLQSIPYCIKV